MTKDPESELMREQEELERKIAEDDPDAVRSPADPVEGPEKHGPGVI